MGFNLSPSVALLIQKAKEDGVFPATSPEPVGTIKVTSNSPFSASATAVPQTPVEPPKLAADLVITPAKTGQTTATGDSTFTAPATESSALYQEYLNNLSATSRPNVVSNYKPRTYARYVAPQPMALPAYKTDLTDLLKKFQPRRFAEGGEANGYETSARQELEQQKAMDALLRQGNDALAVAGIPLGMAVSPERDVTLRGYSPVQSQVRPYVDYTPARGRVTEMGLETGGQLPYGGRYGAGVAYSPDSRIARAQGQVSMPLGKNSEITAQGTYVPLPGRDAYGGNIQYTRRFAEGGDVDKEARKDRFVTEDANLALSTMVERYRAGIIPAEKLAEVTGLPVGDITTMFGASDERIVSPGEGSKLGEYRPKGPTVMTDENKRIRPGYEFRSTPGATEKMEDFIRRKKAYRSTQMFAKGGSVTDQGPRDTQQFVERQMVTMGLPKETFDPLFSAAVPDYAIDLRPGTGNAGVAPYKDPSLVRDADPELLKRSPATLAHEFEHQLAGKAALRYSGLPPAKNASQAAKNYLATRQIEREDPARAAELNAMMDVSPPVYFMQENMQKRGLSEAEAKQVFKDLKSEFGRPKLARYLMEKFPEQTELGRIGRPGQPLHEYFADLSGLETRFRTDLTQDPYIRRYVFGNDDKLIADYKAVTGLRQERLDAKDLPPYTPDYKAGDKGMLDWIKKSLGYAEGGEVSPEDPFFGEAPSESRSMLDEALTAGAKNIYQFFADPKAFHTRAAQNIQQTLEQNPADFAANFMTPAGALAGVIKPKGGNWLKQGVDEAVSSAAGRLERFLSVDVPGLEKVGVMTKATPAQYAEVLQKGLADLEAGADPVKVFSQTIHSDAENILKGSRPEMLPQHVKKRLEEELANVLPKVSLENWIQKNLRRYITRDMATPEDPVRKMIDQNIAMAEERRAIGLRQIAKLEADIAKAKAAGKNTDVSEARLADLKYETQDAYERALETPLPGGMPGNVRGLDFLAPSMGMRVRQSRIEGGFPEEGLGKSEAAKAYEKLIDSYILPTNNPREYGVNDNPLFTKSFSPEELDRIVQGNQPIYELRNSFIFRQEPFNHLIDEMKNAASTNSGLPKELQLTADDLGQMGIEKAFRHVQRIDDWRYAQRAQADLEKAGRSTETIKEYKDSPKGLKWVQIKKIGDGTEAEKTLADALRYEGATMGHCVGGYCPDVLSGESQIFSLRDRKGMPHVTIEVKPPDPYASGNRSFDFLAENPSMQDQVGVSLDALGNAVSYTDNWISLSNKVMDSPEYQQWLQAKPPTILQIKGKGNGKPKEDYIPYVQDFIKSRDWGQIEDMKNADLVKLELTTYMSLKRKGVEPNALHYDLEGTPYVTKQEFNRLADQVGGVNKYK